MLSDMLKKDYIKLNEECINWEDAILKTGNILLEKNVVTKEYIQETIKSVKNLGPYVVITKGVALPHNSNNIGVNRNGIALMTLKNPINFGNIQNDPVKFIFLFANIDIDSHIDALSGLSNLLEKPDFLKTINNSTNSDEIIKYIKENE